MVKLAEATDEPNEHTITSTGTLGETNRVTISASDRITDAEIVGKTFYVELQGKEYPAADTATVNQNYQFTVPKVLRVVYGLETGDTIEYGLRPVGDNQ